MNATQTNDCGPSHRNRLPTLLDAYDSSIRKVQANFQELKEVEEIMKKLPQYEHVYKTAYKPHIDRTRRVLETVQRAGGGVLTSSGISLSKNDTETVRVALITLRASVDAVKESLSPYLQV